MNAPAVHDLKGASLIGFDDAAGGSEFRAVNPATGMPHYSRLRKLPAPE